MVTGGKRVNSFLTQGLHRLEKYLNFSFLTQGSHRLEKYLNLEGFLKKALNNKFALISGVLKNHTKAVKSPWFLLFSVGINTVDRDLNQNKTVVPLFGAANAVPNKGTTILYSFVVLISPLSQSSISEVKLLGFSLYENVSLLMKCHDSGELWCPLIDFDGFALFLLRILKNYVLIPLFRGY